MPWDAPWNFLGSQRLPAARRTPQRKTDGFPPRPPFLRLARAHSISLFWPDARSLDDLRVLGHFAPHEIRELSRRAADELRAFLREIVPELGRMDAFEYGRIQALHHVRRRSRRNEDRLPSAELVARNR